MSAIVNSDNNKVRRLQSHVQRLKTLVGKYKLSTKTQLALIQLSEQASTVAELSLLYPAIHNILEANLPTKNFYVALLNPDTNKLELSYFFDEKDQLSIPLQSQQYDVLEQGLTGYAFKQNTTVLFTKDMINQYQAKGMLTMFGSPCECWLGVPVKRGSQTIGVMVCQTYCPDQIFSNQQIALFETISLYLSTAIDRVKKRENLEQAVAERTAQLSQQVEQHKDTLIRQSILFRISELAIACNDLNSFYRQIHQIIGEITFAKNFFIVLYNSEKNSLTCPYVSDETERDYPEREFKKGLTEYVITSKTTQLLNKEIIADKVARGTIELPQFFEHSPLPNSWLGAPLFDKNEVMGIIACQSYHNEYQFNQDDVELITFVSQQVANVLTKQITTNALKQSHALLEQRVDEKTKQLQQTNMHLQLQIDERKKVEQQLYHDAHHDGLTGLANRSLFIAQLAKTLSLYQRNQAMGFAVLFIDLDNFKQINDSLGHHAGDRFLIKVANQFYQCIREHDLLARFGGDEFVILLTNLQTPHEAQEIAQRIINTMKTPFCEDEHCVQSGASIGIAYSSKHYNHVDEIIRDADAAMYQAKQTGKGHIEFFQPMIKKKASLNFSSILQQAELSLKKFAIINSRTEQHIACLFTPFIEHAELGKVRLDKIVHHIENVSEFIGLLVNQVQRDFDDLRPAFINISPDFLKPSIFKTLYAQLLRLNNTANLCVLIKESEFKNLASNKLTNLEKLSQLGVKIGLSNVARSHVDLTSYSRIKLDYLLLSNTFCQRIIQNQAFQHQLVGLQAFANACNLTLIGSGPSISNYHKALQPLGLELWVSQIPYRSEGVDFISSLTESEPSHQVVS